MADAKRYRVLVGINYPVAGKEVRAEIGDEVDNLPAESVKWLVELGSVEEVA